MVVDSFRTMVRKSQNGPGEMDLQSFIQQLALFLASWQATTFLIGEYAEDELRDNPIFTVADGLFWLRQSTERNSVVRKLQIVKLRGQASVPGSAYLSHYRWRAASLLTNFWAERTQEKRTWLETPFHRDSGVGQDDGRGHS